jgi:hypothetical protein
MYLNKDVKGGHYNRAAGVDANFRFFRDLMLNFAAAKTDSPESKVPGTGDDVYTKSSFSWRNNFWDARGAYQTFGSRLNDEMGFVPRTNVNNGEFNIGVHARPRMIQKWIREMYPHYQIENYSGRNGRGLQSRYMDWHWVFNFQNSTFFELGVNTNTEVLDKAFTINSKRRVVVQPGRFDFSEHFVLLNSNQAARFSTNLRWGTGHFYDGEKTAYQLGGTVRLNEHLNLSLSDSVNHIDLPSGKLRHQPRHRPRELLLQYQGVRERAGAVQHRHVAVELERAP